MIDKSKKVVWILGAGFSRALGGPLLRDLLRDYSEDTLMEIHQDFLNSEKDSSNHRKIITEMSALRKAYNEESRKPGCPWSDAEQFLDLLETAAIVAGDALLTDLIGTDHPSPSYVLPLIKAFINERKLLGTPTDLAVAARRAIAADCSIFLRNAQVASEKWTPYREWAESLGSNHTVVTFNYDLVPDLLEQSKGKLFIPIPTELDQSEECSTKEDKACVYKVHGSVNWFIDNGGKIGRRKDSNHGIDLSGTACLENRLLKHFAIGVPGPYKATLLEGGLQPLWKRAIERIHESDVVIFVGYRFPPSDAHARQQILRALNSKDRTVITILGPPTSESSRMEHLLKATGRGFGWIPISIPLYAEDFLSLYQHLDLV